MKVFFIGCLLFSLLLFTVLIRNHKIAKRKFANIKEGDNVYVRSEDLSSECGIDVYVIGKVSRKTFHDSIEVIEVIVKNIEDEDEEYEFTLRDVEDKSLVIC